MPLTTTRRGPLTAETTATSSASEASAASASTSWRVAPETASMGESSPCGDETGAAADDGGGGTDEAGDRHQVDVAGALAVGTVGGLATAGERGHAEDALAVADGGDGRDAGEVEALRGEQVEGGELGQQHAGQAEGGTGEVTGARLLLAGEPALGLEGARKRGGELAGDRGHPVARLLDESGDPGDVRVLAEQVAQGREPVGALASEGHGELLALVQTVRQGAAALGGRVVVGQRGRGELSHARITSCSPREPEIHLTFFTRLSSDFSYPSVDGLTGLWQTRRRHTPDS